MEHRASSETQKCRILIVDDHPVVCRGLQMLIAAEPDLEVCGEAASVSEALRQVEAKGPDVVVVDLTLEDGHGLELIREIRSRYDHVKVLVSSMHEESLFAERVLRAGAMGYVNKQESSETIIEAIRHVRRDEVYLSSRMAGRLLNRSGSEKPTGKSPLDALTDRELEVFELIGRGLSTRQIARRLELSQKTIESHRDKIRTKLGLSNSSELVRHATLWVLEGSRASPDHS